MRQCLTKSRSIYEEDSICGFAYAVLGAYLMPISEEALNNKKPIFIILLSE